MPLDVHMYDRYRPSYPDEALVTLERIGALSPTTIVADVGSGTGIFAELLLKRGRQVYGVEPLAALRGVAEARLSRFPAFTSIAGAAEESTLGDRAVNLVTAASALHWFHVEATRSEFQRILAEPGWVVALWNFRTTGRTTFGARFDQLWREELGPPPAAARAEIEDGIVPKFFGRSTCERYSFPNPLPCSDEQLVGLVASSSRAPARDDPKWQTIERRVRHLHRAHQKDDEVQVPYETVMYCGRLP